MSKKGHYHSTSVSNPIVESGNYTPRLFSRRISKGSPFVISESTADYPYDKRESGQDYVATRNFGTPKTRHHRPTSSLVGLGIYSPPRTTRRVRRYAVFGLVIVALLLFNYHRQPATGRNGKVARSTSSIVPGPFKRLWSPAADALSTPPGHTVDATSNGQHTFHPNGLLLVNPAGRHPIHVLIENAEKKWRSLLKKQSSTLEEAVVEYKARYKRNPPAGFDKWWNYARQNKVVLVDEYDQVSRDFEPYWALEPSDMRHRNKVMQDRDHTFTLSIKDGQVTRHGVHKDLQRAIDMQDLISRFSKWVPGEVNMTFIIDDQPAVMLGWNQREKMLELARQGEYWGPSEFVPAEDDDLSNFAKACPPNSAIRHSELSEEVPPHTGLRTFIHDHPKAVNLCNHPDFRDLHGHTTTGGVPLTPLVPLFTWAKTSMHADILVTPLEQYDDDYLVFDPPFEYKTKNKLMWRGSTTGSEFRVDYNWEDSQRARLHFMAAEKEGDQEYMWSDQGAMRLENATMKEVNDAYMDVKFSGVPAQCDPETCALMEKIIDFAPTMGLEESNEYRYLMDVDGNGWSGRFHRLLSTNAAVLKSTVFPEWYQDRIVPWVHYIPIKVDYSDLYDVMAFFVGSPDGKGAHDDMAKRIGEAGKEFAQQHWRRVDMAAYMFRLVLEYGRLLHQDQAEQVDYYNY